MIKDLLEREEAPSQYAKLAIKLGVTEAYIRMLANDTYSPGWRIKRDIEALYGNTKKE